MIKIISMAAAPAVSVTVNNSNAASGAGWFGSLLSGVRDFTMSYPYITYAVIGVATGVVVYFVGGHVVGKSAETVLSEPVSTARIIQSNANLRAEMETTRTSVESVRDTLVEVKLELARAQSSSLVELAQQAQATDIVVRETANLLVAVNTNVLGVHESIAQLAALSGHA